jgi:molybdopterin-guanine dinucleotide biosynthesis protein A
LANRDKQKMATCFLHQSQDFPEPLLTLWEPQAGAALLQFASSGNLSPRAFLERWPVRKLHPPNDRVLLNVNYPHDLDDTHR